MGNHSWDISITQVAKKDQLIPAYLTGILTHPTFLALKVTFFIMYLHIFGPLQWLRLCGYAGVVFTTISYGTFTILAFVFDTPRRGETWFSHESANEQLALSLSVPQSVVGLAIDLAILVLPIIAVMQLQLPTRRKVGIILVFMTGVL
ncbi:MAG: hypothetical protein Q9181_004751 [Wetmoreana brouardii]